MRKTKREKRGIGCYSMLSGSADHALIDTLCRLKCPPWDCPSSPPLCVRWSCERLRLWPSLLRGEHASVKQDKKRFAKNILRCRSSSTSRQAWKDPDYPLLENFLWRLLPVSIQDVNAGIHPFGSFLQSRFISAPTHLLTLPAS